MQSIKNKSKGEINYKSDKISSEKALLYKPVILVVLFCSFNFHPECTVSVKLSSYNLEKRNASHVKLLIKALLKCQKQLYSIEE